MGFWEIRIPLFSSQQSTHLPVPQCMHAHWMGNPSVPKYKRLYKKPIFMQRPHFPGCLKLKLFYLFKKAQQLRSQELLS